MSYDVVIFEETKAPRVSGEFIEWMEKEIDWKEDVDYNNPEVASKALRLFYDEITKTFPDLNGPNVNEDEIDEYYTEYDITPNVIFMAFGWTHAEKASELVIELLEKYNVGLYDPGEGKAYFSIANGSALVLDLYPE